MHTTWPHLLTHLVVEVVELADVRAWLARIDGVSARHPVFTVHQQHPCARAQAHCPGLLEQRRDLQLVISIPQDRRPTAATTTTVAPRIHRVSASRTPPTLLARRGELLT
jgi:hypothetical protein